MIERGTRDISHHTQLFVDDHLVERMAGLRRTMHTVDKHPANPLILPEQPFETRYKHHYTWDNGSVIFDPKAEVFRAYWSQAQKHTSYAESDDGIHWRKPVLRRVSYAGTNQNNILMEDESCTTVAYNSDNTDYPYFMLSRGRHFLQQSGDGIEWQDVEGDFQWGRMSDSGACVYDPFQKRYITIHKARYPIGKTVVNPLTAEDWDIPIRVLGMSTSQDRVTWSPWREVLRPDESHHRSVAERYPAVFVEGFLYPWRMKEEFQAAHDLAERTGFLDRLTVPPQKGFHHMDFMNMIVIPYHNLYIGLLEVLNSTAQVVDFGAGGRPRPDSPGQDGTMEVQLVYSRDLIHWQRLGERFPFIPLGDLSDWDRSMLMPFTSNHIVRDGKLYLYYGGSFHSHRTNSFWNKPGDYPKEMQGLGLATLRQDGFVSLDAGQDGGELITWPLSFDGDELRLNADARGGLAVEVLDVQGAPIPGFELDSCVPLGDDDVAQVVRWRRQNGLGTLRKQPVRLRFCLRNARLYSFATATSRR